MFRVRFPKAECRAVFPSLTGMQLDPPVSMLKIIIIKLMSAVIIKSIQKFRTEMYFSVHAKFLNKNKLR